MVNINDWLVGWSVDRSADCLSVCRIRSIRELPGDTELEFEDSVPRMNVHVPFAAAIVCGRGRSSGRDIGCSRNNGQ